MKRKFNLNQLKKLHSLSKQDLRSIKGGKNKELKKKDSIKSGSTPPILNM